MTAIPFVAALGARRFDVHLLASALLTPVRLRTLDAAFAREAKRRGVALE